MGRSVHLTGVDELLSSYEVLAGNVKGTDHLVLKETWSENAHWIYLAPYRAQKQSLVNTVMNS
jgi:hypothetical protein